MSIVFRFVCRYNVTNKQQKALGDIRSKVEGFLATLTPGPASGPVSVPVPVPPLSASAVPASDADATKRVDCMHLLQHVRYKTLTSLEWSEPLTQSCPQSCCRCSRCVQKVLCCSLSGLDTILDTVLTFFVSLSMAPNYFFLKKSHTRFPLGDGTEYDIFHAAVCRTSPSCPVRFECTVCTHKHRHPPAPCEQGFLPETLHV
jgi:hypothetical protein